MIESRQPPLHFLLGESLNFRVRGQALAVACLAGGHAGGQECVRYLEWSAPS